MLAYRLRRMARRTILQHLGLVQGSGFRTRFEAQIELEEYLSAPPPPRREPRVDRQGSQATVFVHPLASEYRLLGAPIGADWATVKLHWRRYVREVHPDRYPGNPEAAARASDRHRAATVAYKRLSRHLGAEPVR
jgi:hypothetical protein